MNQEIIRWLTDSLNWEEGIQLLERYSNNKMQIRIFKQSSPKYQAQQLEYELKKLAGIPMELLFNQRCSNAQLIAQATHQNQKNVAKKPVVLKPTALSKTIVEAKTLITHLYTFLAKKQNELYLIGESNDKTACKQRSDIIKARKPVIAIYDQLYNTKEDYFRCCHDAALSAPLLRKIADINQQANTLLNPDPPTKNTTKKTFSDVSDLQLVKRKNALASSITKTENMLNYQSITRLPEPHPMPEGDKRTATMLKLTNLKTEFRSVVKEINNRLRKTPTNNR
ncbi:MAG: hypothetical protein PHR53_02430 [Bacteroidales bacterium]|nr:hypothetical protein [Bacteroidales bacterium]